MEGRARLTRRALLHRRSKAGSRIPKGSAFYAKFLPGLILFMGIGTVILILIALAVLIGLIPFQ